MHGDQDSGVQFVNEVFRSTKGRAAKTGVHRDKGHIHFVLADLLLNFLDHGFKVTLLDLGVNIGV